MDYNALETTYKQLFGPDASKDKPDNFDALTDWFSQLFGATSATTTKRGKDTTTVTPNAPSATNLAAQQGPTAYNDAMRANLGLDVQQGGVSPTSGMAQVSPNPGTPYWYQPVTATPNPLQDLLGTYTPPDMPTAPTPGSGGGGGGGGSGGGGGRGGKFGRGGSPLTLISRSGRWEPLR